MPKGKDVHIPLQLHNVTAVTFLNNMGGTHSKPCNKVTRDIWLWCMRRNIWLTTTHIPGIQNTTAEKFSRKFQDRTEWQLKPNVFNLLIKRWEKPEIDLLPHDIIISSNLLCRGMQTLMQQTQYVNLSWGKNMCISFPLSACYPEFFKSCRKIKLEP